MYAPFCRTEYVDMSVWENDIKNMSEMGYKSKSGCMNGIKSVAVNAVDPTIIDETTDK